MPVVPARLEHLVEARSLVRHGRRAYSDFGLEDLPELLARGPAVVGMAHGRIWGVACAQVETRPVTMPVAAPTRAYLRCIAVHHDRPALQGVMELTAVLAAVAGAAPGRPGLLVNYGMYDWLAQGLARSGFELLDTVEFFQLERLRMRLEQRPPQPDFLHLRLAEPHLLPQLAALDARAFPPLWHFGERDLVELCLRCRVQVAYAVTPPTSATAGAFSIQSAESAAPVGYAAVGYNSRDEAQLARLAVAPDRQGQGIGRALLWDAIADAVATKHRTLVLNTQHNNHRSQRLYLGMGFQAIGEALPVFGKRLQHEE